MSCSISLSSLAAVTWTRKPTCALGTSGYGSQGHVDAPVEKEPPHGVDVVGIGQGQLDDRVTRGVERPQPELGDLVQHSLGLRAQRPADVVALGVIDVRTRPGRWPATRSATGPSKGTGGAATFR